MTAYHVWGVVDAQARNRDEVVQAVGVHPYEGAVADAVNAFLASAPEDFGVEMYESRRLSDGYLVEAYFTSLTEDGDIEWHRFVEPSDQYYVVDL